MDLNERETLVKVQQQLVNSIENQAQISESMREIFSRIDRDSKSLEKLKSDVRSHIDMSAVKLEAICSKIEDIIKSGDKLEKKFDTIENRISTSDTNLNIKISDIEQSYLENLQDEVLKREKFEKDQNTFNKEQIEFKAAIKATLRNTILFITGIATFISLLSPFIIFLIKKIWGE